MVKGIGHITFIVHDLEKTARLFCEGLGATEVYDSGSQLFSHSPEKFFVLGNVWIAAMHGEPLKERSYNHIAFEVDEHSISPIRDRLKQLKVDVLPDRPRVEGEGKSLYFYDYDNHLFELHAGGLSERLTRYLNNSI